MPCKTQSAMSDTIARHSIPLFNTRFKQIDTHIFLIYYVTVLLVLHSPVDNSLHNNNNFTHISSLNISTFPLTTVLSGPTRSQWSGQWGSERQLRRVHLNTFNSHNFLLIVTLFALFIQPYNCPHQI